jgi:cytoskeletal protein CcmA (bactofilin family)
MFGKPKESSVNNDPAAEPAQEFQRSTVAHTAAPESTEELSSISSAMTIVGKISGEGTVKILGRVEGELRASIVLIADGGQVEGDIIANELTVGGSIKGTIHASRVKLNSTAIVEGDIFHRSLTIEENARFEGSSRREDNIGDSSSRSKVNKLQSPTQATTIERNRKPNGPLDNEANINPPAE